VERNEIGVGLIGVGTVGSGVAAALLRRQEYFAQQVGKPLVVRRAAVRDINKPRSVVLPPGVLTDNVDELLDDPTIDVVVEVIGGEEPAGTFIRKAIRNGKHVVTANKELIAKQGPELLAEAHGRGLDIMFEASVGGGIPLIAPLRRDLLANDIRSISAIINGTTNYILTRMAQEGASYDEALGEAQELGYAEPDPTNDVEGFDACYKLAIMATLGFRTRVTPEQVQRQGITGLQPQDFSYADELGYVIKLLATAHRGNGGIVAKVTPAFLPQSAPLAKVDGVYNAVQVEGDLTGTVMFQGEGAGADPTTSAVIADLLDLAHSVVVGSRERKYWQPEQEVPIVNEVRGETRYYLRINVRDEPGVLAQIAHVLGTHQVSISGVSQRETDPDEKTAELVIMTHPAPEAAFQAALTEIEALAVVLNVRQHLPVEQWP
jgi:homoserine dehydrogenase